MTYPIYNSPEAHAMPSGLYLGLFHGRDDPNEELEDWGFDGPQIGPLEYIHTTYGDHIKVCLKGEADVTMNLHLVESMIEFEGKYYGDWTIFCYEQRRQACVPVPIDRRKA